MTKLIPVANVRPGDVFSYHDNTYRRATPKEEAKHPCRFMVSDDPEETVVLAYCGTMPVTFLPRVEVTLR